MNIEYPLPGVRQRLVESQCVLLSNTRDNLETCGHGSCSPKLETHRAYDGYNWLGSRGMFLFCHSGE